jgi:succinyl-diaminopimelate desuccinylase
VDAPRPLGSRSENAAAVTALAGRLIESGRSEAPWDTRLACDVLEDELPEAFELERLEPEPGHRSLVATCSFDAPGRTLILCGHLDVVPANEDDGWARPPFRATLDNGRLYGRGACDMKGAVAALAVAATGALESTNRLAGKLVLAAVADEETGGRHGAGALVAEGRAQAEGVVVAEPSDGGICISHRGMCFVEVATHGRAGHAAMPERSENAVELMVDVLTTLRTLQLTYESTVTAMTPGYALGTVIHGGTKSNVVPDRCRSILDVRKVTGMSDDTVLRDIWTHLERAGIDTARIELAVQASGEAAECAADEIVVAVARDAYRRQTGNEAPLTHFPAATDAFWFANHAGSPTVAAFGPGGLAGCHIVDESVCAAELELYARIYQDVIETFLSIEA